MSKLMNVAVQYGELGYKVFPCMPGEKIPMTTHGLKDASSDTDQILTWWEKEPRANIGLVMEAMIAIDVDGADNVWPNDTERAQSLAVGPLSLTPRGGRHHIFKQPEGKHWGNTAGTIANHVDTRGYGGYIIAPPSIIDGKEYRWAETYELDDSPNDLPIPPQWFIALLDGQGGPQKEPLEVGDVIPSGQRNDVLARLGGAMRRIGMGYHEIYSALLETNRLRCDPSLTPKEVSKIARSITRYEPDQVAVALIEAEWETNPPEDEIKDPGAELPEHLLNVPGFIGQIIKYNLSTSHKPQPVLALGGAICLQAVLAGRKVRDCRGNRTNVYIIGVAKSGVGKDRSRKVNKEILFLSALEDLEGEEDFASDSGLIKAVEHSPAVLFQVDEIGRILKTIGSARQGYLYNIATALMKLYSSADIVYRGKAYADDKRNARIIQPCVSLYGMTVPDHFYGALTPEALIDGFLARMIVMETNINPKRGRISVKMPPDDIIKTADWWGRYIPGTGNLSREVPDPYEVNYTDEAWDIFDVLATKAQEEAEKGDGVAQALWARAEEKACRLALIYACSRDPLTLLIDADAANWGKDFSEYTTQRILWLASEWVAENPFDAKQKSVVRMIRAAGGSMLKGKFNRKTKAMTAREREELVQSMKASGIIKEEEAGNMLGRRGIVYKLL